MTHIAWHRNGHGRILGVDAHISHDSFLDSESTAAGRTYILGSSSVIDSQVINSNIFNATVDHSHAINSFVVGADVKGCVLHDASINTLFGKRPYCDRVELDGVIVEGDAALIGPWSVSGNLRIPTGVWFRPPRHLVVEGDGVEAVLTESSDGHALIACMRKPVTSWLRAGRRLGRMLGWSDAQTLAAHRFMEQLKDEPLTS